MKAKEFKKIIEEANLPIGSDLESILNLIVRYSLAQAEEMEKDGYTTIPDQWRSAGFDIYTELKNRGYYNH